MADSTATNLKEATNKVNVIGVLAEKKLELKTNEDGVESIGGTLAIKTDEFNTVTFKTSANKYTKENKKNSIYKGLVTVMNTYKSIADVGAEEATIVEVNNGQINPYSIMDENGMKKDFFGYKSNFFNKPKSPDVDFKAEANFEMFVYSLVPEVATKGDDAGMPTGRIIINGWMPTYNNGIEPVVLIAPADIADVVTNTYTPGDTAMFYADIKSITIVEKIEVQMAIGKPRTETKYTYSNELIMTGGTVPYTDEDARKYSNESIRLAVSERDIKLKQKADEKQQKNNNNAGAKANNPVFNRPTGASNAGGKPRITGW